MRLRRVGFWTVATALLAPAVGLTLARLSEPPVSVVLQYEAFLPFALPLYLLASMLLCGGAVAAWRKRRTLRTAAASLTVLAVLGLVLHGYWFAPLVTGVAPAPAAGSDPVTVMSANLLGGRADPRVVVGAVRGEQVDVLVLIEVTSPSVRRLERAGLRELLPHSAGRSDLPHGITGTMVFAREPVEQLELVRTVADSLVVSVGDLELLAVHPVPPLRADAWLDDHAALLDAARRHRPDLVVGDFNATLDHAPMREYGDLGYRDAVELTNSGWQPTWPTRRGPGLIGVAGIFGPVAQIDHVLLSEGWTALTVATEDLEDSDHRVVSARVARTAG